MLSAALKRKLEKCFFSAFNRIDDIFKHNLLFFKVYVFLFCVAENSFFFSMYILVILSDKFSSIFGEIRAHAAKQLLNAAVQCPNDIVHYTRDYQWRKNKSNICSKNKTTGLVHSDDAGNSVASHPNEAQCRCRGCCYTINNLLGQYLAF